MSLECVFMTSWNVSSDVSIGG